MSQVLRNSKYFDLDRRFRLLMGINALLLALQIVGWSATLRVASDILQWATLQHVSPLAGPFDYPVSLLWGIPASAIAVAWVLRQGGSLSLAVGVAGFPLIYLAAISGCFYLLPLMLH
jgi:hypothetical protein